MAAVGARIPAEVLAAAPAPDAAAGRAAATLLLTLSAAKATFTAPDSLVLAGVSATAQSLDRTRATTGVYPIGAPAGDVGSWSD